MNGTVAQPVKGRPPVFSCRGKTVYISLMSLIASGNECTIRCKKPNQWCLWPNVVDKQSREWGFSTTQKPSVLRVAAGENRLATGYHSPASTAALIAGCDSSSPKEHSWRQFYASRPKWRRYQEGQTGLFTGRQRRLILRDSEIGPMWKATQVKVYAPQ